MFSILVRKELQQHIFLSFYNSTGEHNSELNQQAFTTIKEGKPAFNHTDWKVPPEENLLVSITN